MTLRNRRTLLSRIALLAVGLLSPVVALVAAQPGASTAGKYWNAPVKLSVAGGTTTTTVAGNGKYWN
ncbi:MAG TPA: hypothetical protein VKV34_10255 [Thermoleophilia bacterium]|nr:hypothetical protein [Thermoleophilia bacterium]